MCYQWYTLPQFSDEYLQSRESLELQTLNRAVDSNIFQKFLKSASKIFKYLIFKYLSPFAVI